MNKFLSAVFVMALVASCLLAQPAKISGTWQLSMDSPHGPLKGPFKVEQDGTKLKATYSTEMLGTVQFTGTLDGKNVVFEVAGNDMTFKMNGTIDGDQMSGTTSMHDGAWKASRQ